MPSKRKDKGGNLYHVTGFDVLTTNTSPLDPVVVSDKKTPVSSFRALDQERHKVLEIDSKGNLYLYRSALLCKNEIIKRLTEDNFKLVEPSVIGKIQSFTSYSQNSGVTSLAPLPSLRTADAFPVVRKCVCCSQATHSPTFH